MSLTRSDLGPPGPVMSPQNFGPRQKFWPLYPQNFWTYRLQKVDLCPAPNMSSLRAFRGPVPHTIRVMPPPPFDVLDNGDDERHPAEVDPISDEDAARIDADFNNPRDPLGRTNTFARHLETLDHGAIAAKMVQIIDFMASLQMDTATFLHYLSWNLEIPGCMVHRQSVIRYLQTLAQAAVSAR
ncbi:hypothetical protein BC835DRAFT_1468072 [Cytidiella melzeri]|nr:hypothetical protein BC835DRAFT_1468072 [Cytidiella melzeri]